MKEELAKMLLEKTRRDYDLIARDFSRTRWDIWAEFSIFRDYVQDGDRILDIGCGNGRLLNLFKDKKIDYTGVDNSGNQIEEAKNKYPDNRFSVADARALPSADGSFDKVFLVAALHNVPSREFRREIIREASRVMKDNGLLILTVWDPWRKEALGLILKYSILKLIGRSKMDWFDVFVPWASQTDRYYHFFSRKEVMELLSESGFRVIKTGVAKNETGRRSNLYFVAQKSPLSNG